MTDSQEKTDFQTMILNLQRFWGAQGCVLLQPYDVEMGAGTFHPATFLRALGPEHWKCAYVQPSRRPDDGRYGQNPNRLQHYYQFQVVLKPRPDDVRELYYRSLQAININPEEHDIKFIEDDWESPTLGAWGLGWEVRCDGMEITQFTYFQQVGGIDCEPVCVEITYGLERIAMFLQNCDNIYDLVFCEDKKDKSKNTTYGKIFRENEKQFSAFNFEYADVAQLQKHFEDMQKECQALLERALVLPAYDYCLKASHLFNILDARGAVSHAARPDYIKRVRDLACACAQAWVKHNSKT